MAEFLVTTTNDDGAGSLRAALAAAAATPEADRIEFAASLAGATVTLASALAAGADAGSILVTGDIDGDGTADVTLAAAASALIDVSAGADLALDSLRLTATLQAGSPSGVVSAIANRGTLTLTNVGVLDTFVTAVNEQTAATVHNYAGATLVVSETAFAGGVVVGAGGSATRDAGAAVFGVLNRGTLAIDTLGFQGGTAIGGRGGDGVAGIPGGDGGAAVVGVLNEGVIEASGFSSLGIEGGVGRTGALAVSFAETPGDQYAAGVRLGSADGGQGGDALSVDGQPGQEAIGILERLGGVGRDAVRFGAGGGPLDDGLATAVINNSFDQSGGRVLLGFDGADVIYASPTGFDTIFGGAGDDNIALGGASALRAYGGAGDDIVYLTDLTGNHVILGGAGTDAISFRNSGPQAGEAGIYGRIDSVQIAPAAGLVLIIENIESVEGTEGNDTLIGSAGDNRLTGFGGLDSIEGGGGADYIVAGSTVFAVAASDGSAIDGGAGDDTIVATGDGVTLRGAGGADLFRLSAGALSVNGGADAARDRLEFTGDAPLNLSLQSAGAQTVRAGLVLTLTDIEDATGTAGDDTLRGAAAEANRLDGADGDDELRAGGAGDTLIGGDGADMLFGAAGAQRMEGGDSADRFFASAGNDTMLGGAGADRFEAGAGSNRIEGGAGSDTVEFGAAFAAFTIVRNGAEVTISRAGEVNRILDVETFLFADGARSFAQLFAAPVDPPAGRPTAGDDVLTGTAGPDRIDALAGNDRVTGLAGADALIGGAGRDTLDGSGGRDTLQGGGGRDRLEGAAGADRLEGGRGADFLTGGAGRDRFQFGAGDGQDRILDWRDGQDRIEFLTGVDEFADLTILQRGDDVLIRHLRGAVRVEDADAAEFTAADFLFA